MILILPNSSIYDYEVLFHVFDFIPVSFSFMLIFVPKDSYISWGYSLVVKCLLNLLKALGLILAPTKKN